MQRLEVSGAVRPLKWPLGVKWLRSVIYNFIINAGDNDCTEGHSKEGSDTSEVKSFMHVFLISFPYNAGIFGIVHSVKLLPTHLPTSDDLSCFAHNTHFIKK
jgi:hypothetical protein